MMEMEAIAAPDRSTMMGMTQYAVTLVNPATKERGEFPLAAPTAEDIDTAKDFIVKLRTKKVVDDIAALGLDSQTKAALIAGERQSGRQQLSVLCDIDGIYYLTFLMAKRGGFPGDWGVFRKSLQDGADVKQLQDWLFDLCGIEAPKAGEKSVPDPFVSQTTAP